jgi:hypothetical protein
MASYHASETGQITFQGEATSSLAVHEALGNGPLCNTPIRDWRGHPGVFTNQGPGTVTCGHCARRVTRAGRRPGRNRQMVTGGR